MVRGLCFFEFVGEFVKYTNSRRMVLKWPRNKLAWFVFSKYNIQNPCIDDCISQ